MKLFSANTTLADNINTSALTENQIKKYFCNELSNLILILDINESITLSFPETRGYTVTRIS